jgi:hypothetical protein
MDSDGCETNSLQIFKSWIIELRLARRILYVSRRYDYYHSLSRASEKNAIGILLIILSFRFLNVVPTISAEGSVIPAVISISEIGVPSYAGPIELEALDGEFSGDVFKVI